MDSVSQKSARTKDQTCIVGGKSVAVLFTVGVVLAMVGGTFYPIIDRAIQDQINEKLVLNPDSTGYAAWAAPGRMPSVPIYAQFFVFNVVNFKEVKQGNKPLLEQKGPYSYREYREKQNITWESKNSTVSYNEKTWFVFDPDTSCDKCDPFKDYVYTVNLPLITVAELTKDYKDIFKWKELVSWLFSKFKENLFQKRTVDELLWGYRDPILEFYENFTKVHRLNFLPKIDTVIALQQNNSFSGFAKVRTGFKSISQLEVWVEWKGKSEVGVWNTTYCNMINGTDGTQFAPGMSSLDTVYVFVTQLCRSLYLTFESLVEVKGISALKFTTPEELFLNGTLNANNKGFCSHRCYPSGLLDISVCQHSPIRLPLFVSAPHFYLGDPILVAAVDGLSPNAAEHATFLKIEPHTGLPIHSAKRLQINALIEPIKGILETIGIPKLFLPIFYINETAKIDPTSAKLLKEKVLQPFTIVHILEFGLVCVGGVLVLVACVFLIQVAVQNRKLSKIRQILLAQSADEKKPLIDVKPELLYRQ